MFNLRSFTLCAVVASTAAKTLWHELDGYTFEQYEAEYSKR